MKHCYVRLPDKGSQAKFLLSLQLPICTPAFEKEHIPPNPPRPLQGLRAFRGWVLCVEPPLLWTLGAPNGLPPRLKLASLEPILVSKRCHHLSLSVLLQNIVPKSTLYIFVKWSWFKAGIGPLHKQ